MDVESILDLMPKPDKEDGIVWTPRIIAKKMIDNLPKEVWNHNTKFLDPVCKSGIFLEEILNRLMELDYWKEKYINIYERRIEIVNKQLFGIAGDKISKAVTDRVLYCQLVDNSNIKYIEKYKRLVVNNKLEDIIKKEFNGMKFDVIIGNPPYQQEGNGGGDGVGAESAEPLYNKFMEQLMKISVHYISLIIPSRWYNSAKPSLAKFRGNMINSKHITKIFNFENSSDVFKEVGIAGGVMYFVYDNNIINSNVEIHNCKIVDNKAIDISILKRDISKHTYLDNNNNIQYIIFSDNNAETIVDKLVRKSNNTFIKHVLGQCVFNLESKFEHNKTYSEYYPIKVVCNKDRVTYTNKSMLRNTELINKYKVVITRFCNKQQCAQTIISEPKIIKKNEVCVDTFLVVDYLDNELEAINVCKYLKTKLARFLIGLTVDGLSLSAKNFIFVPYLNFNEEWTDEKLYKKFSLTDDEIDYIEQKIRTMD